MNSLTFSYNWNNKLNCSYFTTLRLSGRFQVGEWVLVYDKNKNLGRHRIEDKKRIKIKQLNSWICGLDSGYTVAETIRVLERMYPNQIKPETEIYLYLVRKPVKEEQKQFEQEEAGRQTSIV
ncbi:MAG: hypothetical protein R3A50_04710 [Saprospiraceae bacterium]